MLIVGSALRSFYLIYSNHVSCGQKIQLIEAVSDYFRGTVNNIIMMTERCTYPFPINHKNNCLSLKYFPIHVLILTHMSVRLGGALVRRRVLLPLLVGGDDGRGGLGGRPLHGHGAVDTTPA